MNIWYGTLDNQLIGQFIIQEHSSSEHYLDFLQNELAGLLERVSLQNRLHMWLQQNGTSYFGKQVTAFLNHKLEEEVQTFGHRSHLTLTSLTISSMQKSRILDMNLLIRFWLLLHSFMLTIVLFGELSPQL